MLVLLTRKPPKKVYFLRKSEISERKNLLEVVLVPTSNIYRFWAPVSRADREQGKGSGKKLALSIRSSCLAIFGSYFCGGRVDRL